ncbi:MAG: hypothetical protein K2J26_02805 [Ruminococcus sp.]|nr:hypothetical protein [Ruminococcus sp.]
MKNFFKRLIVSAASIAAVSAAIISVSALAEWKNIGFMGDLNGDRTVSVSDAVILTHHLLGSRLLTDENRYYTAGKFIGIGSDDTGFESKGFLETADMNRDGKVNIFDLVLLRKSLVSGNSPVVWEWLESAVTTVSGTSPASSTSTSVTVASSAATSASTSTAPKFIAPPIYDLYGSMPSQGNAEVVVFYVDFPDCRYTYTPDAETIEKIAFGNADENNRNYPFESMSAFFERSSKGAMKLGGKAYTYTAKNNKSAYEGDSWHVSLVDEIIAAFDKKIDFSEFDGDGDKIIDTILISVPESAGTENWWPAAGVFGGDVYNRADGMNIGHVIVGNAEITSPETYSNFVSSYLHEMGHCMGLPDFYLYGVEDFQGMHGSAGFEMMDDANCDFGAASKLQLGWYSTEQINIFDRNTIRASYELKSGQTDDGNCVIIPVGELDPNYRSEYFILEYTGISGNNTALSDEFRTTGSGIRIYHVEASENGDSWYNTFRYASGNDEETNYNNGRRFIRLVGEGTDETDNLYRSGDIIDNSNADFRAYDSSGGRTGNIGVTVEIGEMTDDCCIVTVYADYQL